MEMRVVGSSSALAENRKFLHKKVIVLGKTIKHQFFEHLFPNFLKLTKKYALIFEILGSIQRTGCGKLHCIQDYVEVFF